MEAGSRRRLEVLAAQFVAGELLKNKLVVRLIGIHAVTNPLMESDVRESHLTAGTAVAQNRVPLASEVIGVVIAGQQTIDQFSKLVATLVVNECFGLFRGR